MSNGSIHDFVAGTVDAQPYAVSRDADDHRSPMAYTTPVAMESQEQAMHTSLSYLLDIVEEDATSLEFDAPLQATHTVEQAALSPVSAGVDGRVEPSPWSSRHASAYKAAYLPDLRSSFLSLMDSFDTFMEAWASNVASPVPSFMWSCMELCPHKQSVHPLRAAALLSQRSFPIDSHAWMPAPFSMDNSVLDLSSTCDLERSMSKMHTDEDEALVTGTGWVPMRDCGSCVNPKHARDSIQVLPSEDFRWINFQMEE